MSIRRSDSIEQLLTLRSQYDEASEAWIQAISNSTEAGVNLIRNGKMRKEPGANFSSFEIKSAYCNHYHSISQDRLRNWDTIERQLDLKIRQYIQKHKPNFSPLAQALHPNDLSKQQECENALNEPVVDRL